MPSELKAYAQWVNWRMDERAKVPVNPYTQGNAGVHWPNSWASFDVASQLARSQRLGIGFVLTDEDPYTCVDLDDCVGEHGQISHETRSILDLLSGWVELSPSGKGLHVWMRNEQSINRRMKGIEVYSNSRWITVSGRSHPHALRAIPNRTDQITELTSRYFPNRTPAFDMPTTAVEMDDDEIWQRLFCSRNGDFFRSLFTGDISICHSDHSRAVIMLANQLAMLTELDGERVKRLLYQTGMVNEKWEEKRGKISWIDYQILDAINYVSGDKQ